MCCRVEEADDGATTSGGVGERFSHIGVHDEGFQAGVVDEISEGSGMGVALPSTAFVVL
jgi:hypothetical protein